MVSVNAQTVVVSEYQDNATRELEWTEIITRQDFLDLRNWKLGDNNASTASWQEKVAFNNTAVWERVRGGTIIIVRHGLTTANDVDFADGFVDFGSRNTGGFNGGNASNTLNVAATGDFISIIDNSNCWVHGIGHDASPGSSVTGGSTTCSACWASTAATCPATAPDPSTFWSFRQSNISSGQAIAIVNSHASNAYNVGVVTTTTHINIVATGTLGLANNATVELDWRAWREPQMTSQTVTGSICGVSCASFTWVACTDPYPADNTQGYLILSNTTNSFGVPVDGTMYTVGTTPFGAGNGYVVANLDNTSTAPGTMSYTDNSGQGGTTYYRIYAYRYSGSGGGELERGRAYNETNFVTVELTAALPVELLSFTGVDLGDKVRLDWKTQSEVDNDRFVVERSIDGLKYIEIGQVGSKGNTSTGHNYEFFDHEPKFGTVYYRLRQIDLNDSERTIAPIAINRTPKALSDEVSISQLTNQIIIQNASDEFSNLFVEVYSISGQLIEQREFDNAILFVDIENLSSGFYLVRVTNANESVTKRIFKD